MQQNKYIFSSRKAPFLHVKGFSTPSLVYKIYMMRAWTYNCENNPIQLSYPSSEFPKESPEPISHTLTTVHCLNVTIREMKGKTLVQHWVRCESCPSGQRSHWDKAQKWLSLTKHPFCFLHFVHLFLGIWDDNDARLTQVLYCCCFFSSCSQRRVILRAVKEVILMTDADIRSSNLISQSNEDPGDWCTHP